MLIGGLLNKLANPAIVITGNAYQGILTHSNTLTDKTYTFPDKTGIVALISDVNKTGFPNRTSTTLTWNTGTRTITLAPTGTNFTVSVNGTTYTKTTQTSTIPNVTGGYFIYFDNTGTLQQSTTPWDILTTAPIAYVYYDTGLADGFAFEERHGDIMDPSTHYYLHNVNGTEALTGFAITGYDLAGAGGNATNAFNTFAITTGNVADEDIIFATTALADNGPYTIFSRTGATGTWTWTKANTIPFKVGTTFPQYNQWTGSTWQMTEGASLRYINYFVYATLSLDPLFQYIIIPGQNIFTSLAGAQSETYSNLSLGTLPFQEIVPLYQITLRTGAGVAYNGATGSCRIEAVSRIAGSKTSISQASITNHEALSGLIGGDLINGHYHLNLAQVSVFDTSGNITAPTVTSTGLLTANSSVSILGKIDLGTFTIGSRFLTNNGIVIHNIGNSNTSVGIYQAGVGTGHIGFLANDSTFRIVNAYSTGNITDAASIALTSAGNVILSGNLSLSTNASYLQSKTSGGATVNLLILTNDTNNITRFIAGVDAGGFQWTNQAQSLGWMSLTSANLAVPALTTVGNISGLSFSTNNGNNGYIQVAGNGASTDPYGTISVTNPNSANNYTYFGMTRASTLAIGIGINTSNLLWIGGATSGVTGSVSSGSHWFTLNGAGATFLGSVTTTGVITSSSSIFSGSIYLKSAPDSQIFQYQSSSGVARWATYLSGTELGSDSGSNLIFVNYTDAGTFKNIVLNLNRATGNAVFNGNITASSIVKSGGTSSQILKADGSILTQTNAGTQYLRDDGTWQTITATILSTDDNSTNATYYPAFFTTAGGSVLKTSSLKLTFNPSNNRLGIGTATPGYGIDVKGTTFTACINTDVGLNFSQVSNPASGSVAQVVTGTGNLSNGAYYYVFTFITALGETNSYQIGPVTVDATHKQTLLTIPISADYRVTGRKLYRTLVNGSPWNSYYLATISDNVTTTYQDNIPDSSLTVSGGYFQTNTTNLQITINASRALLLDQNLTMIGIGAGHSLTSGGHNTLIGFYAGYSITTSSENTIIGDQAGVYATSLGNTLVGYLNGYNIASGSMNTGLGRASLYGINGSGSGNVSIGYWALGNPSSGSYNYNTSIGWYSGYANTGNYNIYLGAQAGYYETGSNTLIIDSLDRGNQANARIGALLYGLVNSTVSSQTLAINAATTITNSATITGNLISQTSIQVQRNGTPANYLSINVDSNNYINYAGTNCNYHYFSGAALVAAGSGSSFISLNNSIFRGTISNDVSTSLSITGGTSNITAFTGTISVTKIGADTLLNIIGTTSYNAVLALTSSAIGNRNNIFLYATNGNFIINSYNSSGTYIDDWLTVQNSTNGIVTITRPIIAASYSCNGSLSNNGLNWTVQPVPVITGSGVMEIGKYIDWHESSNDGIDFAARMNCTSGVIGFSGGITCSTITASGLISAQATTGAYAVLEAKGTGTYTIGTNRSTIIIHRGVTSGNQSGLIQFGTPSGTSIWQIFNDLATNGTHDFYIWNYISASSALSFNSTNVATFGSSVTASSFSGAGTGLTGTASSLTSGTATVSTTSTINTLGGSSTAYLVGTGLTSGNSALSAISSVYMNAGIVYATDFSASSDERLKENWQDLPLDFISKLAKVKVGTYYRLDTNVMSIGASAQSLQNIMPLAVHICENEMLSISYGNAALVSAVELAKEVEKLKFEIEELKKKIA